MQHTIWMTVLLLTFEVGSVAGMERPGYLWEDLGSGIYVSRTADPFAGPVDGNAVVLVNDRDVVLIDTHIDPAATRDLLEHVRTVTDNAISLVVNTHWHDDHVNGNAVIRKAFPQAVFLAHPVTLDSLHAQWQSFEESRLANYRRVADVDFEAAAAEVEATDPERAMNLRLYGQYRDALLPELAGLELVYPDSTFTDLVRLERGDRTVEIRHLGIGNTAGDVVVWLPEERVLISGDMVVHPIPYAYDVDFQAWMSTLDRLLALGPDILIPGHGSVQHGTDYVVRLKGLFRVTLNAVEAAANQGLDLEQIQASVRLEKQATLFAGDDPAARFAFETYFRKPAIESVWRLR